MPERGTITSLTRVSRRENTPSRMLRSSGIRPVTPPLSIRVSSSPAESTGTSSSQLRGSPTSPSTTAVIRSISSSRGERVRVSDSSSGASFRAEASGRCSTQALGNRPPITVASSTSTRNTTESSQACPSRPAKVEASWPARLRPVQPTASRASTAPSWVATSTPRSRCCSRATDPAPGTPSS